MRVSKKVKPGTVVVRTKNGWLVPMDIKKGDRTPIGVWDGLVVRTNGWYPPRRPGQAHFSISYKNRTARK